MFMSRTSLFLLGCFATASALTAAPSIADYAGTYRLLYYEHPNRLIKTVQHVTTGQFREIPQASGVIGSNEKLVDTYLSIEADSGTLDATINANGTVSLPGETLPAAATATGQLVVTGGDGEHWFHPLPTRDLLLSFREDQDALTLLALVKPPAGVVTQSDLAGQWQFVSFNSAVSLIEGFWDGENVRHGGNSQDFASPGEQLVDVRLTEEPELLAGTVVLNSNGQITGDVDGSFSIGTGNVVLLNDGEDILSFYLTSDRNVMVGIYEDGLTQNFMIALRKGTAPAPSELAGSWRLASFMVPRTIRETWRNAVTEQNRTGTDSTATGTVNEVLVDVADGGYQSRHWASRLTDGGMVSPETGTFSVNGAGAVVFNVGGETVTMFPTINRDLMVGVTADSDSQELLVMFREPRLDFQLAAGTITLNWGGKQTATLQHSVNGGPWSTVGPIAPNGTSGQAVNPTGHVLFRILPTN